MVADIHSVALLIVNTDFIPLQVVYSQPDSSTNYAVLYQSVYTSSTRIRQPQ